MLSVSGVSATFWPELMFILSRLTVLLVPLLWLPDFSLERSFRSMLLLQGSVGWRSVGWRSVLRLLGAVVVLMKEFISVTIVEGLMPHVTEVLFTSVKVRWSAGDRALETECRP